MQHGPERGPVRGFNLQCAYGRLIADAVEKLVGFELKGA